VVGNKVQHQTQPRCESVAQSGKCTSPPVVHAPCTGDRKSGTGNVLLAQVEERLLKLLSPLGIAAKFAGPPSRFARRSGTNPVETHACQVVQLDVRNIIQRRRPATSRDNSVNRRAYLLIQQRILRFADIHFNDQRSLPRRGESFAFLNFWLSSVPANR